MTLVVPAVLGGLAIAVMALVSIASSRRTRRSAGHSSGPQAVRILVHSINDDRCTGCDACVAVCPTNVLDLVENKSRVLRFQDCIQCEACMWACPTTALVMHPEGTEPPRYRLPDLDEFFQTRIPGQYLIGEVAGKPLVKNAANLGRAVVEHMLATGLRPAGARASKALVNVAIVGSGPGGLSAALACVQRGLSYVLLEKDAVIASTISSYPKGKLIMAEPYDTANLSLLPVFDSSKEEILPIWKELIDRVGLKIRMNESVEQVVRGPDGLFEVRTIVAQLRAQRVVLATGLRGKPRTLGVTGENQPKVHSLLEDPDQHRGQTVCVVGGGDSALEAAIALADAGAKVILSYRGRSFNRAQPRIRQTVESYEAQRRIKVKYQSDVIAFSEDTVTLQMVDGQHKRYPNQAAFVLIGADPPIEWLATMGIHFTERPHMHALPPSDKLVARFLGAAALPCSESAAGAAALVLGQELPAELARRPNGESRPRKWLRSASKVFTSSGRLDRPMPLAEFAQQARRHSGHGRRDKLDARERTRVLRMLRDEGGRQADEDSRVYLIDHLGAEADHARQPKGSPPPDPRRGPAAPARGMPGMAMVDGAPLFDDPVMTIPPTRGGFDPVRTLPPGRHEPVRTIAPSRPPELHAAPPSESDTADDFLEATGAFGEPDSPKAAVIVGLARATAQGPRARKRPRSSSPAPIVEVPTRQLGSDDVLRLQEKLASHRHEDPTRQVNLGGIDGFALGSEPFPARPEIGPAPSMTPARLGGTEEATRMANPNAGTLSDVEWDLD